MKNDNDIVVTGMSSVTCLGNNLTDIWNNLVHNKEDSSRHISNYNPLDYPAISKSKYAYEFDLTGEMINSSKNSFINPTKLGKFSITSMYLCQEAILDSGINLLDNRNGGVFFSTITGEILEKINRIQCLFKNAKYSPEKIVIAENDFIGGLLSGIYGLQGPNMCIMSACTSSILSIDYASRLLKDGDLDFAIIGACDINSNPLSVHKYQNVKALSIDPICRPLSKDRNGMSVGDGGGFIILEKRKAAEKRNARIYAAIKGIGIATDDYHPTHMSENNVGIQKATQTAFAKANLYNENISYINSHATGTIIGDIREFNYLDTTFPGRITNSFKGYIGHLGSSSGIVELIFSIMSMNNSMIIRSANVNDPLNGKIEICIKNETLEINNFLKTTYGFGGKCATIIIGKE